MGNPTTVMEWLETLEEPYRSRAIANFNRPNYKVSSQSEAVSWAFNWEDSPEKDGYWLDFWRQLYTKEEQASDPKYQISEVWEVAPNGKVLVDVVELAEWKRKAGLYDRIEAVMKGGKSG